jgi:multiple sugar transport system permease protein
MGVQGGGSSRPALAALPREVARFRPRRINDALTAYLFLAPYLVIFLAFLLLPALAAVVVSFTRWGILGMPRWLGLQNYRTILTDAMFWKAFRNTLYFTLLTVPPLVAGGLGLAVLFNQPLRGRVLARTVVFMPYAIMVTVVGMLWSWMFNSNFGLVNFYIRALGLPKVAWLTDAVWAMPAVALSTVWWQIGTNMVIYLAGLQEIPAELYEAARVDGAGSWNALLHITVPGLYLMHVFVVPLSVIASLRAFGQILVMTHGGPFGQTYTLVQHLYATGWVNFRMGEASAVGVVLLLLTLLFTIVQLRYFRAI